MFNSEKYIVSFNNFNKKYENKNVNKSYNFLDNHKIVFIIKYIYSFIGFNFKRLCRGSCDIYILSPFLALDTFLKRQELIEFDF